MVIQRYLISYLLFIALIFNACNKVETIPACTFKKIKNFGGKPIEDLFFVDSLKGWVVGLNGLAYKTTDGGKTWNFFSTDSNKSNNYDYIFFRDSLNGLVRYNGYIVYSADGGNSWNVRDTSIKNTTLRAYKKHTPYFGQLFYNPQVGIETNIPDATKYGTIRMTDNGGKSWQSVDLGSKNNIKSACFKDIDHILVVGYFALYSSNDRGKTWSYQRTQTGESVEDLENIQHLEGNRYIASDKNSLYSIDF